MEATLLNAELQVAAGVYGAVALAGGGQSPKMGWKWNSRRAPVTPRIKKTITVSIPKKPSGLMKREGNTIFRARRRVLSSLSHIHLRSAMIGSKTPFFALGCPANSGCPVQIRSCYVARRRVVRKLDPWQRQKSQVKCRSCHRYRVRQSILTSVTRTLKPEFSRPGGSCVAGIHDATKVNTGQIESGDLRQYRIIRIERIHEFSWYRWRFWQTRDHVLVIRTSGDRIGKIEKFGKVGRRISLTG